MSIIFFSLTVKLYHTKEIKGTKIKKLKEFDE